ncbi:MAG: hypothetical protein H0W64_00195 [Gammaproteobacteria bacterium]|nr:hypothetical protein [Gammaproteobacteria bacterium]
MSSTRTQEVELERQSNDDFEVDDVIFHVSEPEFNAWNVLPSDFPPETKLFSTLKLPNKEKEDAKRAQSAHSVNIAYKLSNPNKLKIFKNNTYDPNDRYHIISAMEAAATAFFKFMAPKNVPSLSAYVDFINPQVGYDYVGAASNLIPNFKANADDPLKPEDIVIDMIAKSIDEEIRLKKKTLIAALENVNETLKREPPKGSGLFYAGFQQTKNWLNGHRDNTALHLKNFLLPILNSKDITSQDVDKLLSKLLKRQLYVASLESNDPLYKIENKAISEAIEVLEDIISASFNVVRVLDEIDQKLEELNIDLSQHLPNDKICETIAGEEVFVSVKDMRNYRIVKRQAIGLICRYCFLDTDGHNRNMSKLGDILDFDMSLLPVLFQFRKVTEKDRLLRKPDENMFMVTAYDIANFPDIKNANFYYWVTKETWIPDSLTGVSSYHLIPQNFFRKSDNKTYKALARHPAFVYNKYLTLTKFMVLDESTFRNIARLHVSEKFNYVDLDDKLEKNGIDEITKLMKKRLSDVKNVVVNMRMYQKFIGEQGQYAEEVINKEFETYRAKNTKRLAKHQRLETPHVNKYKDLLTSIHAAKMKSRFTDLYHQVKQNIPVKSSGFSYHR